MYTINGTRVTFTWPNERLHPVHNMGDLIEGMRVAATRSVEDRNGDQTFSLTLPGIDQLGVVEAKVTNTHRLPSRQYSQNFHLLSSNPYLVIKSPTPSIYFRLEIPGICHLMAPNLLAINLEASPFISEIVCEVFNYCTAPIIPDVGQPSDVRYFNLPSTNSMLSKKPKVPKNSDFMPIFTQLFGEKIATVIMKEISK